MNATGYDAVLRTGAGTNGQCGAGAPATERPLPRGLSLPAPGACWCCALKGETGTPASRARTGRIVLAQCFGKPAR